MAAMFSFRSLGFSLPLPRIPWIGSSAQGLDIPSVEIHEIEESPEKRARTLKHIIRANHINHSIIYHHLQFHNHAPHILGSAYLLGASVEDMHAIYDRESTQLEPWVDAPGEISKDDWRDYLGKREYQRAWVDFYEDQLVQRGYDWNELLDDFLFKGREPLINNLVAGLGHPLIHLGYAYELNSHTLAIEALSHASSFYSPTHKYIDDPSYTKPSPWSSDVPLEVLQHMSQDPRFSSLTFPSATGGVENFDAVSADQDKEALMLEYWNSLTIHNLPSQFEFAQRAAVCLLVGSHEKGKKYDFFLVHVLTSSHALRIVLPKIDKKWHVPMIRQWFLFVVQTYISQGLPKIDQGKIYSVDLKGRDWSWVEEQAVSGKWRLDAHFVKAIRAIKVIKETWGDDYLFLLKAAVGFVETFDGWGGFGTQEEERAVNEGVKNNGFVSDDE